MVQNVDVVGSAALLAFSQLRTYLVFRTCLDFRPYLILRPFPVANRQDVSHPQATQLVMRNRIFLKEWVVYIESSTSCIKSQIHARNPRAGRKEFAIN